MSVAVRVDQLCEWTGGSPLRGRPEQSFTGTAIDSRSVGTGEVFFAIVGPNHDGHRFVGEVLARDVAGVVIQSDRIEDTLVRSEAFIVHVEDTTRALADLARGHRSLYDGPLIGITGSNGKTTTKELCAGILSGVGSTLATHGNLNNNFGVPLTLLRREPEDRFAVIEMGMNHRGEISTLCEIAHPTIGVLTNVGTAHIEFLGSRETIALEKGDLLASLPDNGTAVVGFDDPLAFAQADRTKARVLSFGRQAGADLLAGRIRFLEEGAFCFDLSTPFGRGEIHVAGLSETIVDNALCAAGAALAAGVSFEEVQSGLAGHAGVSGRMQPRTLPGEVLLIDDSYNANPQSMHSALESLARLETRGHRFAVLGPMGELGEQADAAHRDVGRWVAELELDGLFALGDAAPLMREGALEAGFLEDRIHLATDHRELARSLQARLGKGDRILVKGSRAARMERVIEGLEEENG